jgi:hypothetical protein
MELAMSLPLLNRRIILSFLCSLTLTAPAQAFDILPDPKLHLMERRIIIIGKGPKAMNWHVWDINKAHYGGEGKLIWSFSQKKNPIPTNRKGAEAWFKLQLTGVAKALGGDQPKLILASMEMAGSDGVFGGPPFTADFNLIYDKREQIVGNIYVMKVVQGKGRIVVFMISPEDRTPEEAPADFARLWGKRLKDMHPNESR